MKGAPHTNVSITKDKYFKAPDIDYNIPKQPTKNAERKGKTAIHKPKYHSKYDLRVGNNIITGGVEIMAVAKYLFTDVRTQRFLIECLEKGDDGELALAKALRHEQDMIKKRDEKMRENYLVFSDDDTEYLKLLGINPNDEVSFGPVKYHELIDANGHFRTEGFKKLLHHIHGTEV